MREPGFWRHDGAIAALLSPLAAIYGGLAARRMAQSGARAGVPVICVGNFIVGGAGKTPTAIALAHMLIAEGGRPFFLTRGYGGRLSGPVRVEPGHRARDVGDEPLLLARAAPTVVARDRVAGAARAVAAGADVIVMDDGFQNPSLHKDFALIVIDGEHALGNGRIIPAGPLRAPLAAQLERASALLVVGDAEAGAGEVASAARARGRPVLRGFLAPDPAAVAALAGRKTLAFAGIARPQKFFATLESAGIVAVLTRAFPDHHRYSRAEATALAQEAAREGLTLLTTEKDLARIEGDADAAPLAEAAMALPVKLAFEDADAVRALLGGVPRGKCRTLAAT